MKRYTLYQQIVLLEHFIHILECEMKIKHSYEKAKRAGITDDKLGTPNFPAKPFDAWSVDDWELHHSLDSVFIHYDKKLDTLKKQMFPHRKRTAGVRHNRLRNALFPRASNYHNQ